MRKVIYTCIVGGYDELRQPEAVDPSYNCICFSNDFKETQIGVWAIRKIPASIEDKTRLSRYVKILPHRAIPEYDVSVWIDANISIKTMDFYGYIESAIDSGCLVAQVTHLGRDCVYDEIIRCYQDRRLGFAAAKRQWNHLKEEGYPRHFGLYENNLIFRRHTDSLVMSLSEEWWQEYLAFSSRDQLSLMPVYWRNSFRPNLLLGADFNTRNVSCLGVSKHPSHIEMESLRGIRRLPLKVSWTWRRLVANMLFR